MFRLSALSLALLAIADSAEFVLAQDAGSFFAGKNVTIVVGTPPGGGFDTYARLLSRHLGKHLPGQPNVIVSNMPGADSNIAAAYVARSAAKDGTFIAAPTAPQPLFPILAAASNLNYDPAQVNYLGSAASDDYLCVVRSDAPATTFAQMLETPLVMGGTAENGITGTMPIMLDNVLGTKFKVVLGYPGTREITVAMQRGEVHGMCGMNWSSLTSQFPDLIKSGAVKIVVQENGTGVAELNKMGIPLTVSYARDDEQRRILDIVYSQEIFARPYFVAAEVPPDRLEILRRAFMESWRDPELVEEAAKMQLGIAPLSGDDVQGLLRKIYASPPDLLRKVRDAIKQR